MQRIALCMIAVWLVGAAPAHAQGLPEGTFASSKDGCAKLVSKTPAELGADLDFYVLNKTGVTSYLQRCDFVAVAPHDAKSWVATAFCDEQGYVYPDMFAIAERAGGELSVTRVTDLTQEPLEGPSEDQSATSDDLNPSQLDRDQDQAGGDDTASSGHGDADTSSGGDAFDSYVRCENVKP
ncbi:MAG TPA: hypothetical protein VF340_09070 [Methyloceanibacter sp.]|jgi:hypothetical protein